MDANIAYCRKKLVTSLVTGMDSERVLLRCYQHRDLCSDVSMLFNLVETVYWISISGILN